MKPVIYPIALVLALAAAPARAGVSVSISIGLPVAPPLVAVAPGISVVEGFPDEVFFYDGGYWCRRPDGWYWARHPRDRFAFVEGGRVPRPLMRERVGYYRDWHPHGPRHEARGHRFEERGGRPGMGPGRRLDDRGGRWHGGRDH
jgi:hypothetical protein